MRLLPALFAIMISALACVPPIPRTEFAEIRRGYSASFFSRHDSTYRRGAAFHVAHGKQHDVLELTPLERAAEIDARFDEDMLSVLDSPPRIGPTMMSFAPHVGQIAWPVYNAIDWTHGHHDATYDILSDDDVPWLEKERRTREAVEYYLRNQGVARSPAPLEITMARAAVMMKPYFGTWRTHYPRSTTFFYVAHWWHPAVYEAIMVAGNDDEQEAALDRVDETMRRVLQERPQRMLLSREIMPRYSRMSPESANIFDNLHMLHGIVYDILSYEGWSAAEKRAELDRVVAAMSEQPGDRELARAFALTRPDLDPRRYDAWMTSMDGAMTEMMQQMLTSMWPMMSPDGSAEVPAEVMDAFKKKMRPGLDASEHPGSLHDAIMALVPDMKMDKEGMKAGVTPKMQDMMVKRAQMEARELSPVEPMPMQEEPALSRALAKLLQGEGQ